MKTCLTRQFPVRPEAHDTSVLFVNRCAIGHTIALPEIRLQIFPIAVHLSTMGQSSLIVRVTRF